MDDGWGVLFMAVFAFLVLLGISKTDNSDKKKPKKDNLKRRRRFV